MKRIFLLYYEVKAGILLILGTLYFHYCDHVTELLKYQNNESGCRRSLSECIFCYCCKKVSNFSWMSREQSNFSSFILSELHRKWPSPLWTFCTSLRNFICESWTKERKGIFGMNNEMTLLFHEISCKEKQMLKFFYVIFLIITMWSCHPRHNKFWSYQNFFNSTDLNHIFF